MKKFIFLPAILLILLIPAYAVDSEPVAVVLSGGGARGAYQIGVWKALLDLDINIGAVYGVSVGAINGAVMAMGDFDTAKELWKQLENDNVMKLTDSGKQLISGEFSFGSFYGATNELLNGGGIDVSPLEGLLEKYIDEDSIRKSGIDFGLAAYSLTDSELKYLYIDDIPNGRLVDFILASANFPLFKRKTIGGEEFIDGGVLKNTAVEMVDSSRFESVVIVGLDVYMPADFYDWVTGFWSYDFDATLIRPRIDPGSMLDFTPDHAVKLMKAGYLDALRQFGIIRDGWYYVYGSGTIGTMFGMLNAEQKQKAVELLGIKMPPLFPLADTDWLYSKVIEPVLSFPGLERFGLIEGLGFLYDIPLVELYSEADFLRLVTGEYRKRANSDVVSNPSLDFISYLVEMTGEAVFSYDDLDEKFLESWSGF